MLAQRGEHPDQIVALGRLLGYSERAHADDRLAAVGARNDMDRDVAGLGIVLQQVEQHEPVDVGEAEIESDRARLQLAGHRQRARARGRDHALEPGFMRDVEQDRGEGRVVLDDQHERTLPSSSRSSLTSKPVGSAVGTTAPLLS